MNMKALRKIFDRRNAFAEKAGKPWYRIEAKADEADVWLMDEIGGWGVTAQSFVDNILALGDVKRMTLHINSPGGDVFDGIAIRNVLRDHDAHVTARIEGLAASAASFIALAGDEVEIAPQAQVMIHDASAWIYGNAEEMRQLSELLDRTSQSIAEMYAEKAGGTATEWRDKMRAETWYMGEEAVDAGLCDRCTPKRKGDVGDKFDLSAFVYAGQRQTLRPAAQLPDIEEVPSPIQDVSSVELEDEALLALANAFKAAIGSAVHDIEDPLPDPDPELIRAGISLEANNAPAVIVTPEAPKPSTDPADDPYRVDSARFTTAIEDAIMGGRQ